MSMLEKVNELTLKRRTKTNLARERIEKLFDLNSFVEIGFFNEEAGVITGYGTVNGRLVYAYSQNSAVNVKHANKIGQIYEHALKMGAPIVGIMDSNGVMLEDGIDTFEAYGILFSNQTAASGVVPQISVIMGDCMGVSSFNSVLSDFVFMTDTESELFMSSPATFEGLSGKTTSYEQIGNSKFHSEKSGIVHFRCENDEICMENVRTLISFLPSNNLDESASSNSIDDLNRVDESLNTIITKDEDIDVRKIICSVADNEFFFEVHKDFAKNIIVGFVRFNGYSAGIIANNGLIDIKATQKAGEFINICDAFNIPIVTFTNTEGYVKDSSDEKKGLMRYCAKLLYLFSRATIPKVNILLKNAIGSSYLLMNSKHIGADIVYAWPTAEVALMNKEGYVNIMGMSEEEFEKVSNPYKVASQGYIDDIIVPSYTRKRILIALEMLSSKRQAPPARKHSSIEF